jgi:hypothetical protein
MVFHWFNIDALGCSGNFVGFVGWAP